MTAANNIALDIEELKKLKEAHNKQFSELLETLSSMDEKRKSLWKEIYENAATDRQNAYMCYVETYNSMSKNNDWAILGPVAKKFLDSMAKATDQLLELTRIIAEVQEAEAAIDPEEIYSQLESKRN